MRGEYYLRTDRGSSRRLCQLVVRAVAAAACPVTLDQADLSWPERTPANTRSSSWLPLTLFPLLLVTPLPLLREILRLSSQQPAACSHNMVTNMNL